jgi:hypothetical protein
MVIQTFTDIIGANTAVQVSNGINLGNHRLAARKLWLTPHGSNNARFGDASVSATQGVEMPADVLQTFGASEADPTDAIDLTNAWIWVPTGTTITRAWGV